MPRHPSPAIVSRLAMKAPRARQRGATLFIVIVFVMLSMLLALWASRTALFNELVVGNDADYQRAFEAAQALIQDAELDIRGEKSDGSECVGPPCRAYSGKADMVLIPGTRGEFNGLIQQLAAEPARCKYGLCARRIGRQDFWNYVTASTEVTPSADPSLGEVPLYGASASDVALTAKNVGARYGEHTGAVNKNTAGPLNPILVDTRDGRGGWYWIEVMPYVSEDNTKLMVGQSAETLSLYGFNVVYRITALAHGLKPGNTVVLQETYVGRTIPD